MAKPKDHLKSWASVSINHWQLEGYMADAAYDAPHDVQAQKRSNSVNAHLTLARVQAACALVDDARDSYAQALETFNSRGLSR